MWTDGRTPLTGHLNKKRDEGYKEWERERMVRKILIKEMEKFAEISRKRKPDE
jgi:hypothetical protein